MSKHKETITKEDVGTLTVPPPSASTALTAPPSLEPAAMSPAAQAFLDEAKGKRETPTKVPLVNINHRDGGFKMPNGDTQAEISGYPVYYFHTRRFYKKPPQAGAKGAPPDCWSGDLVVPSPSSLERQHETCAGCPMNEFGTGRDGRSKACGTYTWVFLLNPQFGNPPLAVVIAPPSSLRPLVGSRFESGYFAKAAAKAGVYEIVWTTFRLKPEGDPQSVQYCTLLPVMGPSATDLEQVKQIAGMRNKFLEMMNGLRDRMPDVEGGGEEMS